MKILITGVSSGIGYLVAQRFLNRDFDVVGICRHAENIFNCTNYYGYNVDFSKNSKLEFLFKNIHKSHFDINVILCCSGFGHFAPLEQFSFSQMQALMNVNFMSHALLIRTLLPSLRGRVNSKIIAIGSECALVGNKLSSFYSASKFALRGFLQSVRKELAKDQVSVSLINPGLTNTAFYDSLYFKPGSGRENSIEPLQIVDIIDLTIKLDNNMVMEEINILPMKNIIKRK